MKGKLCDKIYDAGKLDDRPIQGKILINCFNLNEATGIANVIMNEVIGVHKYGVI